MKMCKKIVQLQLFAETVNASELSEKSLHAVKFLLKLQNYNWNLVFLTPAYTREIHYFLIKTKLENFLLFVFKEFFFFLSTPAYPNSLKKTFLSIGYFEKINKLFSGYMVGVT